VGFGFSWAFSICSWERCQGWAQGGGRGTLAWAHGPLPRSPPLLQLGDALSAATVSYQSATQLTSQLMHRVVPRAAHQVGEDSPHGALACEALQGPEQAQARMARSRASAAVLAMQASPFAARKHSNSWSGSHPMRSDCLFS
jgi:hypothetical protein